MSEPSYGPFTPSFLIANYFAGLRFLVSLLQVVSATLSNKRLHLRQSIATAPRAPRPHLTTQQKACLTKKGKSGKKDLTKCASLVYLGGSMKSYVRATLGFSTLGPVQKITFTAHYYSMHRRCAVTSHRNIKSYCRCCHGFCFSWYKGVISRYYHVQKRRRVRYGVPRRQAVREGENLC